MTDFLRTWAEIDLDALDYNFNSICRRLGNKKIMAVVKANAYGHGAVQTARALSGRAYCFAVATLEEAVELRRSGITSDILILSPVPYAQFPLAVKYNIITVLFSREGACALSEASLQAGKESRAYIAVDTGMSRIGLPCDDSGIACVKEIISFDNINICGILSHYACADSGLPETSLIQSKRFDGFVSALEKNGLNIPLKSVSNTAAAIDFDEKYDVARIGIALYGMYPSDSVIKSNLPLKPVMSLKTKITQIKTVPSGTGISYGHTYITSGTVKVATLAAGYADGIPLSLSGKGKVIINGHFANILGRVCMDQMMVDATDIDNINVGDTAVIFGSEGDKTITADEVAKTAGTINYDIVCRLDCRVPRVFIRDGKITEIFSYIGNGIY